MTTLDQSAPSPAEFIVTREYRLFAEFCDACRQHCYIGLCYGAPGVGKTVSARRYANWDEMEVALGPPPYRYAESPMREEGPWRTVLYTPPVVNTARIIDREVANVWGTVAGLSRRSIWRTDPMAAVRADQPTLLIVDEVDRLKTAGLEQLRDFYDRRQVGMVFIGMPGLQKRLARYAQLYSRIGFVHQFRPLSGAELQTVIKRQSLQLGLGLELDDLAETNAVHAIARITGGNFRLVERPFAQIERVTQINDVSTLTADVILAAQESLVIGAL